MYYSHQNLINQVILMVSCQKGHFAGILLIWTSGTKYSEILSKIHTFSLKKSI